MALAEADAMGWGPTQWVAALAVAGSLGGVWLGKTLEARYQRKLEETAEKRDQRRALEEALVQAEILWLRLDAGVVIKQAQAGVLPTAMQMAEQAETLRQQADQVQDLLVRSGVRNPSDPIRSLLASLERSFHSAVEELLLFLAISFKDLKEGGETSETAFEDMSETAFEAIKRLNEALEETFNLLQQFKKLLGVGPISDEAIQQGKRKSRVLSKTARMIIPRNLLDLSPDEFRSLVAHLLNRMGLKVVESQQSPDSGADLIAVDPSPIAGGRMVVQIRQYLKPVSAEMVRSLYGAVLHEGASKGLLVTTSTFGAASYKFAKDKPLELIDGLALVHLLSEHTGIEAIILSPTEHGNISRVDS